MAKLPDKISS